MANKITFIIGNGLDISLGMETKYSDFYAHIQKNNTRNKNQIYKAISEDPETWAEFELALGAHTQAIEGFQLLDREKASEKLHQAFDEVLSDLGDYLQEQMNQFSAQIPTYVMRPTDFYSGLLGDSSRKISGMLSIPFNISLITLNYTDTLQRMLNSRQTMSRRGINVAQIHHAHGSLSEYITMGVSNESQISAALEGDAKDDLIKPRLLESMHDDRLATTLNIIQNSEIIVIFGTSYGASDEYIWRQAIDWLRASESRLIVLHDYNRDHIDKPTRNPSRIKQLDNEARNRLLMHAENLDDNERVNLRSRILVVRNSQKLFKI